VAEPPASADPPGGAPRISLAAGPEHRRRVVRLLLGLSAFVLIYLAMLVGCVAAVIVTVSWALVRPWLWPAALVAALCFGPLVVFLIRGLAHRPALTSSARRLDADEQPRLQAFVGELAEAAKAPRPRRISLSPGVNAAMVARFGAGRELVIGLGLINVLDLRELEAALAHEFGHFSQSSTRVGQWAHRATIVLREVVLGRTRFDARLGRAGRARSLIVRGVARIVSVGVHGVRSMLAHLLARITRSGQALARELEFNADLHAVSLCGSDPLVAALWRAQRGALAMKAATAALVELAKHGVFSEDLYVHQQARLAELDEHLATARDPMLQALRRPYRYGPELHFPPGEAPAELTWYSHPSYREREANAKRCYVAADEARRGSAWSLIDEPELLRRELSTRAYAQLLGESARSLEPSQLLPAAQVEARLAEEIAEREQQAHYHGFYANRLVDPGPIDELLEELASEEVVDLGSLRVALAPWRGASLSTFMQRWRATEERLDRLRAGSEGQAATLAEIEAERERQIDEARAGDRAILRWLWHRADEAGRLELAERHRFLAFVQRHILVLNAHHARVARLGATIDPRHYELAADAPVELLSVLDELHRDLVRLLAEARDVALPSLRNLEAGRSLASVLEGEELPALEHDAKLGPWLGRSMARARELHGRLRTLHYKNLGQLLALYERIDPELAGEDQST
jgi:Zn-dependent protease with chaperone function